jgi:hypothetical protein
VVIAIGAPGRRPAVWRLDPGTLDQKASVHFDKGSPYGLAAGSGAIWTLDPDKGFVWRIDPHTHHATRLATIPHHPVAVAAGDGIVWVGVQPEPL